MIISIEDPPIDVTRKGKEISEITLFLECYENGENYSKVMGDALSPGKVIKRIDIHIG